MQPEDDDNDEVDPGVARANARRNFERLKENFPPELLAREDGLAHEMATLNGSPIKRLRALYAVVAKLSDAVTPFAACRAGCNACCHYNVSVFPLEAKYIADWTGTKRLASPLPKSDFHGTACPFLENGQCSIYEHRPMACRKHFALTQTAYWCAPDRCDSEEFPFVNFSSAYEAFEAIIASDRRGEPLDIRQWFGLQLGE